jgi:hypothetical protein
MVTFEDTGAILDAPLDAVWKYLGSADHGSAHAQNARHFQVRETVGAASVISAERRFRGNWTPFVTRSFAFPPICTVNEEIEGDFAGTRFVVLYRSEGNVTRVDVYGEIRSPHLPDAEARRGFLELLQGAYEDDESSIRLLRSHGKL